jgi:hypothetical protein
MVTRLKGLTMKLPGFDEIVRNRSDFDDSTISTAAHPHRSDSKIVQHQGSDPEPSQTAETSLCFPVTGAIAHAAHYVKANWPEKAREPVLDTSKHPMTLTFDLTTQIVRELQETLTRASQIGGPLSRSARAFRMMIATKLMGKVIPNGEARGRDTHAG